MNYSKFAAVYLGLFLAAALTGPGRVNAGKARDLLIDPADNWVDVSNLLALKIGLMPVPIIITEPAVGFGGGGALLYFWDKRRLKGDATDSDDPPSPEGDAQQKRTGPPNLTGVAGGVTVNDTWFAAGFHSGSWLNDSLRYVGGVGYADAKLTFYGSENSEWDLAGDGLDFNLKGLFTVHNLIYRILRTNLFLGIHYRFLTMNAAFEAQLPRGITLEPDENRQDSGLGPTALFDNRDNPITPTRGVMAVLRTLIYHEALGSSSNFIKYELKSTFHWPIIRRRLFTGVRLSGAFSQGDVPFYQRPFLMMRGLPAFRYQGHHTLLLETEFRWQFYKRISVVGFFGAGQAVDELNDFGCTTTRLAGGGGLRYLIARALGMHVGIDVARGPEDWSFYLIVGNAWTL